MPALGEEFRSAREARGLSLSDVAERLHIRSVYLAAIEDEDWTAIGAPVYIRGFMRTYARFLGLDAEAAVARFAAAVPSTTSAVPSRALEERSRESGAAAARPSAFAVLAIVVAVAVVAYVAYAYAQYRSSGTVPIAATSPGIAGDAAVPDGSPAAEPADDVRTPAPAVLPAKAAARKRGLRLALTETSWLRVAIDGTVVAEGTFPAGTTKVYRGKLADVRVGNAGGVSIAVNGRPVGKLGNDGDVAERQFVLSGE
jgi:transcriptional regulator with XRE-family HTH domain